MARLLREWWRRWRQPVAAAPDPVALSVDAARTDPHEPVDPMPIPSPTERQQRTRRPMAHVVTQTIQG
jgi:hypothetical protein